MVFRRIITAALMGILGIAYGSALAFEPIQSTEDVNKAIIYGLNNRDLGYATLLGPNWIEGPEGSLLHVYSPFMLLASQAAGKQSLSGDTSPAALKEARTKMARIISQVNDPKGIQEVKFAVSLYGATEDFASHITARVEGVGHGREVELKSRRVILDKKANPVTNGAGDQAYEAVNAYYFNFNDLSHVDMGELVLYRPDGNTLRYKLDTHRLY
ncbi:MAG: hypothetical protein AB7P76_03995 [Candidatus Melainabacteria bacterium]